MLRTLLIKAKRLRIKAKLQGRIVTVCRLSSDRAKRLQPFRPTTDESRLLCPTPTSIKTIVMYFISKEFSIQGLRCSVSSLSPSRFLSWYQSQTAYRNLELWRTPPSSRKSQSLKNTKQSPLRTQRRLIQWASRYPSSSRERTSSSGRPNSSLFSTITSSLIYSLKSRRFQHKLMITVESP